MQYLRKANIAFEYSYIAQLDIALLKNNWQSINWKLQCCRLFVGTKSSRSPRETTLS